jgi:hypothetical protein
MMEHSESGNEAPDLGELGDSSIGRTVGLQCFAA